MGPVIGQIFRQNLRTTKGTLFEAQLDAWLSEITQARHIMRNLEWLNRQLILNGYK